MSRPQSPVVRAGELGGGGGGASPTLSQTAHDGSVARQRRAQRHALGGSSSSSTGGGGGGDRRRALREFYGIDRDRRHNSSNLVPQAPGSAGAIDHDPYLDDPDLDIDAYLARLSRGAAHDDAQRQPQQTAKGGTAAGTDGSSSSTAAAGGQGDPLALLKLENDLIRDIRVLSGERKSLIYDNYGRMLATRRALADVAGRLDSLAAESGRLYDTLALVRRRCAGAGAGAGTGAGAGQSAGTSAAAGIGASASAGAAAGARVRQLALKYLSTASQRCSTLLRRNRPEEAAAEAKDAETEAALLLQDDELAVDDRELVQRHLDDVRKLFRPPDSAPPVDTTPAANEDGTKREEAPISDETREAAGDAEEPDLT